MGAFYDWDDQSRFLMKHEFGYDIPIITHWNQLEESIKPEHWKWLWKEGIERGLFRYGNNFSGGIEAMRELEKLVHIAIITSRPPQARLDTIEWLAHYRIVIDELHVLGKSGVTGKTVPKSSVKCDIYLDDAPHNLIELRENVPDAKVIGFVRPWNTEVQSVPGIYWAENWPNVVGLVKGFVDESKQRPSDGSRRSPN
jgi:5'(3')-deoxyribonucleotidase